MKKIVLICLMGLMVPLVWASAPGTTGAVSYQGTMPMDLDLTTGVTESDDHIFVWDEQQNVTLTEDLAVDITQTGSYSHQTAPTPGTIPSGTVVSSYIVHFDEEGGQALDLSGSITFDRPILGLIMLTDSLTDTDSLLGVPTTTYDTTGDLHWVRGVDTWTHTQDPFTLSDDRYTISFHPLRTRNGIDEMRIIVEGGIRIDIKPGSYPNAINKNGKGVIPVAILGSADFDVSQIKVSTLSFGGLVVRVKGNGQPQCSIEDVSGDFTTPEGAPDGYPDLVCQFIDDTTTWVVGDGEATLTGQLLDGTPFEGSDSIKVVQ